MDRSRPLNVRGATHKWPIGLQLPQTERREEKRKRRGKKRKDRKASPTVDGRATEETGVLQGNEMCRIRTEKEREKKKREERRRTGRACRR